MNIDYDMLLALPIIFLVVVVPLWLILHYAYKAWPAKPCPRLTKKHWPTCGRCQKSWKNVSIHWKPYSTGKHPAGETSNELRLGLPQPFLP